MSSSKKILIIDDSEAICETLGLLLQIEGYETLSAFNGQEALNLLSRLDSPPALILLDLMMPIMNGFEFAAALEKNQKLSSIPLVLMTAFLEEDPQINNAKAILPKPVDCQRLFQTIKEYCE